MKCYQDCNSNSCCVCQLACRLNHSVKSHLPQSCACFLCLLPSHQTRSTEPTEGCSPWVTAGAVQGGICPSGLPAQHGPCTEPAVPGTCFLEAPRQEGAGAQALTSVEVLSPACSHEQEGAVSVLPSSQRVCGSLVW